MPPTQPTHVDVPVYLTIEPVWKNWAKDAQARPILEGGRVIATTKNRPERATRAGTIITKVTFRIPSSVFLPLQPEAVVEISHQDVETVLSITASDPAYPSEENIET